MGVREYSSSEEFNALADWRPMALCRGQMLKDLHHLWLSGKVVGSKNGK